MPFNFGLNRFARKHSSVCRGQFYNYEIASSSRSNRSHRAISLKSSYWNGTCTACWCEHTSGNDVWVTSVPGLTAEHVQWAGQLRRGGWVCSTNVVSKNWALTFNLSTYQDLLGVLHGLDWFWTIHRIYRIDTIPKNWHKPVLLYTCLALKMTLAMTKKMAKSECHSGLNSYHLRK